MREVKTPDIKLRQIKENWFMASFMWFGREKRVVGSHRETILAGCAKLRKACMERERAFEAERAELERIMEIPDGFYYYEEALLKKKHNIPLSEDNHAAVKHALQEMGRVRDDPWQARF